MWAVRSISTEFPIVVTIMAVSAQDSGAHATPNRMPSSFSILARRLGCGNVLVRSWKPGDSKLQKC